jgi:hypothetical protein
MTDAPPPSQPATTPTAYQPPPGYVLTPAVPVARSRNLGLLAFVVALFVIVATVVASIVIGIGAAPFAVQDGAAFHYNLEVGSRNPTESALAVASLVQGFAGTALGVWALVQGIVAAATRRGRALGVTAIVLAALGPIVSVGVTLATVATHLPH